MKTLSSSVTTSPLRPQVLPTWNGGSTTPAVYVSYRMAAPGLGDSGLPAQYSGQVFVHIFNGTQGAWSIYLSQLQAQLTTGQTYTVGM